MRRFGAFVLLLLISFPLTAPLFSTGAETDLPACCRTTGKHKCAMRMQHQSGTVEMFSQKCASYPLAPSPALLGHIEYGLTPVRTFAVEVAAPVGLLVQTVAHESRSIARHNHGRAPPSLSL